MKNLKLMLVAIVASVSLMAETSKNSDDISKLDVEVFQKHINNTTVSKLTMDLIIEIKKQIKNDPFLDEATEIIDTELISSNTIRNTLLINLDILQNILDEQLAGIDKIDVYNETFLNELATNLTNAQKKRMCLYDPYSKAIIDKGVNYSYLYLIKKNNDLLVQFNVTKDTCAEYK